MRSEMAVALVQLADGGGWTRTCSAGTDALMWLWGTLLTLTWVAIVVCVVWLALLRGRVPEGSDQERRVSDRRPDHGERTVGGAPGSANWSGDRWAGSAPTMACRG